MLTHTLHLPPGLSEIYDDPQPEWLRDILELLPGLQALLVSKLPFFDYSAMIALSSEGITAHRSYDNIHVLIARSEPNATPRGITEILFHFPELIYLDLSYTTAARDRNVLSVLSRLQYLQVLKLQGLRLKDDEIGILAKSIGITVRFLDLRNNHLTDRSIQTLLQDSFSPVEISPTDCEVTMREQLRRPDLDELLLNTLTRPLTSRDWISKLPRMGITHLYVADNLITIEGVTNLLTLGKLRALDVGTYKDINPASYSGADSSDPFGMEILIPLLVSAYAVDRLSYLRINHAGVTEDVYVPEVRYLRPRREDDLSGPADSFHNPGIQELIAKRPHLKEYPSQNNSLYLHPSDIPHVETLVLTDIPAQVPKNSHILSTLVRFITACSDEALLATLQAKSDYSLPPGQARSKAEKIRSKELFSLRHLILEIVPPSKKKIKESVHETGQDVEVFRSAAMNDFSFFGDRASSSSSSPSSHSQEEQSQSQTQIPEIDLVAELAAFRCMKKAQYEDLVRREYINAIANANTDTNMTPENRMPYTEGYWEGKVSIVRML